MGFTDHTEPQLEEARTILFRLLLLIPTRTTIEIRQLSLSAYSINYGISVQNAYTTVPQWELDRHFGSNILGIMHQGWSQNSGTADVHRILACRMSQLHAAVMSQGPRAYAGPTAHSNLFTGSPNKDLGP